MEGTHINQRGAALGAESHPCCQQGTRDLSHKDLSSANSKKDHESGLFPGPPGKHSTQETPQFQPGDTLSRESSESSPAPAGFSLAFKILPLAVTFFREFSFCSWTGS